MDLQRYLDRIHKLWTQARVKPRPIRRPTMRPRLERLEDRIVPTTDTWISTTSGLWSTAGNWSLGAAPNATDDVVINTSPAVTVTLNGSASVKSLTITGDTLKINN